MTLGHRRATVLLIALMCVGLAVPGSLWVARPRDGSRHRDELWSAVRAGDIQAVAVALDQGARADVNATDELGISALWIAANKGKLDVIELLVKRGADVNVRDRIWYLTPLGMAAGQNNFDAAKLFIKAGAKDADAALASAAAAGQADMVELILKETKVGQETLDAGLFSATAARNVRLQSILINAGAKELPFASMADLQAWSKLTGTYESDGGETLELCLNQFGLVAGGRVLKPTGQSTFTPLGSEGTKLRIERDGNAVTRVRLTYFTSETGFYRFADPVLKQPESSEIASHVTRVPLPLNWPSFRGPDGTGVADGQHPPITWNLETGQNVQWKTPIPGLGHSSPIVWGNRIFLTTATSGDEDPKIRIGNYGDVNSVDDRSTHSWKLICLDRESGQVLWARTAHEGVPKLRRHLKGSQANCTPATDGRHVIACFGPEGFYCYDFAGKLLWKRDLSMLDSHFAIDKEYEWGLGNSPVIYDGLAILQCDVSRDSFIAAFRLEDGQKVWSTPRDEIPSWSSPVVWHNRLRDEIVTNAAQYARGYDPKTGAELWRLSKKSEITIPTPVCGQDLLYIASGNRPIQPIFAIRPGAAGDISLKQAETKNGIIVWSTLRGGPYMPTPVLDGPYLYTCSNAGIVTCYEAQTGKEIYKQRMGVGSYTASPVAADGRLYFCSEQGDVRVVQAGPEFQLLAVNQLDDYVMATPAISNGSLLIRTQHFLISLGEQATGKTAMRTSSSNTR